MALKLKKKTTKSVKSEKKSSKADAPKKSSKVEIYCFGCGEKRQMKKGHYVEELVSGRKVRHGECVECGRSCAVIVSKDTPVDRVQTAKEARAKKVEKEKKAKEKIEALKARKKKKTKKAK